MSRVIETKEIEFSQPPSSDKEKELPFLLTVGPMMTMGIMSVVTLVNVFGKIAQGEASMSESWSQVLMAGTMLLSMILWPIITNSYNKRLKEKQRRELIKKYNEYLRKKEKELIDETKLQTEILFENVITVENCRNIIMNRDVTFWSKRLDQNDFLVVRIGMGNEELDIDVRWPEEGFTTEEDILKENALKLLNKYKYIKNVPIGYSLFENRYTAVMGTRVKTTHFVNNIITQLLAFYSYEDLKIVVFTNEQNKHRWDYLKYTNHNISNDKSIRFFSDNPESAKDLCEYLMYIFSTKTPVEKETDLQKPYYLIITDDYSQIKRFDFIKEVTETDQNMGFSILFIENKLKNLPSKCSDFISLGDKTSGILENSYEKQEQRLFNDEVNYTINMMEIAKKVSNVPIEFEEGAEHLPDAITFLEMEKVGKVKQLNVLNRWNTSDSTQSLKAEIGVGEDGNYMYLDLHEKFHGPHGLVAGMTGSGKSEFIITWVLSMCINYSPDDVAFILIDYKGGGLAFAFENQVTGVRLPHLAGTITNLDKAEMDRTLVSIESEAKRRQAKFNEVRDQLGESTIDIYKYQQFYKEGKIDEAMPHLFIICDEFAELKSQQPDFMDNLISIARIGRSLGVHLILATQKPSGVVNDQIWSNAKFHVCLKVQDEGDSNEMLKKPDAANLKQAGRFYLQVGYDEYFALGQSAWCGAKYYPSDQIVKQVDKSINFINDIGMIYKSIQAGTGKKVEEQGEQLAAIMDEIIETAKQQDMSASRLWLENIPEVILVDNIIKKYNIEFDNNHIKAIIGEYDAPEKQEQGLLEYDLLEQGNSLIYSSEGAEAEQMLESILYSTITNYDPQYINYYILDFGSQSTSMFKKAPHVGDIVYIGEDEKYKNMLKMIKNEINNRRKLFADYGGDYINYQKNSDKKLPLIVIMFNNYDAINENDKNLYDNLPELVRDSERYGIVYIMTATGISSVPKRVSQNMKNIYGMKLKDELDYVAILPAKKKIIPRDMTGRGIYKEGNVLHEFQTASIVEPDSDINKFITDKCNSINEKYEYKAKKVPILPEQVTLEYVEDRITDMSKVPVGINKNTLAVTRFDYTESIGNIVTAINIKYTESFARSMVTIISKMKNTNLIVFDPTKEMNDLKKKIKNYYSDDIDGMIDKIKAYVEKLIEAKKTNNVAIIIYNVSKFLSKLSDNNKLVELLDTLKKYEKGSVIIFEDTAKLKGYLFDDWYKNFFGTDGIYIGSGVAGQTALKITNFTPELSKDVENNIGFFIKEGQYKMIKVIEFEKLDIGDEDE
ncbi:MAG: type VII secretion protein EssC [Bacilli bacterium]|nr:type VII secretion protein EssC [Bacilli bacterium]